MHSMALADADPDEQVMILGYPCCEIYQQVSNWLGVHVSPP